MRHEEFIGEDLRKWFKEKWVRFGPDGKIRGDCARGDDSEGKPKCLPQSKAHSLGKKGRASAAARKRREDPNPERSGAAINVATKKKSNEAVAEAGPFSYGAKPPRKGSVAYNALMKRKEQDQKRVKDIEAIGTKNHHVGVAKVTKDVSEGLNEMDKSAPQPGRDDRVSHSTYGSRDKKGSDYFKGKEAPGKAITAKQASKDALDILKKQGVAEGWGFDQWGHDTWTDAQKEVARKKKNEKQRAQRQQNKDQQNKDQRKSKEQGVSEAKSLKKRVRVVQGEHAGKTGWIREIKHGIHSTAPKRYYVDIDGGGQANNLPASALRLLKNQYDDQTGMAEGSGGAKYKVKSIGKDSRGDYYISPSTGKKVYKKARVGDHENPRTGEIKPKIAESDPSGLMHAAKHFNNEYIITAKTAEGDTKRYRVRAQSERTARERFSQHHAMAKIVDVKTINESRDQKLPQKPRQGPLKPQTGAGKHKDKKRAQKQGDEKHKKRDSDIAEAYNPLEWERREQSAADRYKQNFKRQELSQELRGEEEQYRREMTGTWYIRVNGKIVKDKQGMPFNFRGMAAANKAALTMMSKPFNKGKEFKLTMNPTDQA